MKLTFSKIVFAAALLGTLTASAIEANAGSSAIGVNVTASGTEAKGTKRGPKVVTGGISASLSAAQADCKCNSSGASAGGDYYSGGDAGQSGQSGPPMSSRSRGGHQPQPSASGYAGGSSYTSANAN